MVRFKCRYLLFQIHYPQVSLPPVDLSAAHDKAAPARTRSTTRRKPPNPYPAQTSHTLHIALTHSLTSNFGSYGAATANASVKYYSSRTQTGIIRCAREQFKMVWAALTFLTEIKGIECTVQVVHVGGTIKSVQSVAVKRGEELLKDMVLDGTLTGEEVKSIKERMRKEILAVEM
ncbi:subunit of both RNase [Phlyctochytrium arcticum]|nr:subunit of both RNase [Phlyctochytrium arcticum]